MIDLDDYIEPAYFSPQEMDKLFILLYEKNASDITIQSGEPIVADVYGVLHYVSRRKITQQEISDFINHIYGANGSAQVQSGKDLDTGYQINTKKEKYRYRVNITGCLFDGYNGMQITARTINNTPPSLADMNLEDDLIKELAIPKGVMIISGATGSGKSTLLASIISDLSQKQDSNLKILTYESPIEYTYGMIKKPSCIISQCEIPKHLPTFSEGVRNALRRKPGLILVGEARDRETIESVIEASLTGHPVYTTVHSNGIVDTFRRMINLFSADEKDSRLYDLIETVNIMIWQSLVPGKNGSYVPIREYLIINDPIKEMLYRSNGDDVTNIFKTALHQYGHPLKEDIKQKIARGLIDASAVKKYTLIGEHDE